MINHEMKIDVTVVIPLYNKKNTIKRALNSVLDNLSNFAGEIIVVDDGSTDGSKALATTVLDPRISIISQKNSGPGSARNLGARVARGEYVAFLDGDDEWTSGYLDAAITRLRENSECGAYVCGYDAGAYSRHRPNKVLKLGLNGQMDIPSLLDGPRLKMMVDAMHSSCIVIRRAAFDDTSGFYDRDRCTYGEDSFLWVQILLRLPIFWDNKARCIFHVEDSSLGYAVTHREKARPIVLYPDLITGSLPAEARNAFEELVKEFARGDARALAASGHLNSAIGLRKKRGISNVPSHLYDLVYYVRFHLKVFGRNS